MSLVPKSFSLMERNMGQAEFAIWPDDAPERVIHIWSRYAKVKLVFLVTNIKISRASGVITMIGPPLSFLSNSILYLK